MPRNRPGALRGAHPNAGPVWSQHIPEPVHGLSAATSLAIFRVEQALREYYVFVGATRRALTEYRMFISRRGPLYPLTVECDCSGCPLTDSVVHARDVLERVLDHLPPRAKAELARVVRRLDVEFERRTLPDPFARPHFWNRVAREEQPQRWWHGRLPGGSWSETRRPDAPTGSRRRRR